MGRVHCEGERGIHIVVQRRLLGFQALQTQVALFTEKSRQTNIVKERVDKQTMKKTDHGAYETHACQVIE